MRNFKIGIFGAGRGVDIAKNFMLLNCEIVALCDFVEDRLQNGAKQLNNDVALYSDFDLFLEHDMDAVVIANYFHEHTPYIIKCFQKNIHIFCECISNGTMAEGVELWKAAEKTSSIFFLGENYPQMLFNLEMQRIAKGGTLGKIIYAEGEYNHPCDPWDIKFKKRFDYCTDHWRNFLPRTYYITHSLGPVMRATGATPKRVTAFTSFAPIEGDVPTASHSGDAVAIITTQNDDGSIFRVTGCAAFGAHHNAYRICGTEGQIENLRGFDNKVCLRYNSWSKPEGTEETKIYEPSFDDNDKDIISQSGHGGSDYITARMFIECIKNSKQPEHPFDIYSAINMSSVAILAHRSMLEGGMPYDIPDFKNEDDRKKYENDRLSPFFGTNGSEPDIPCCSVTDFKPTESQVEKFLEIIK